MLASLLPGLREIRTPLALGYLWFLVLWLIFADRLSANALVQNQVIKNIFELLGILGASVMLAALSFTAYLMGAVIKLPIPQFRHHYWNRARIIAGLSYSMATDDLSRQVEGGVEEGWRTIRDLNFARDDLRTRLLVSDTSLYGEYDRFAAEAEFRVNVTYPLLALIIVVSIEWTLWALFGLPVVLVLFWQGLTRDLQARSVLIRALLVGKIEHEYVSLIRTDA